MYYKSSLTTQGKERKIIIRSFLGGRKARIIFLNANIISDLNRNRGRHDRIDTVGAAYRGRLEGIASGDFSPDANKPTTPRTDKLKLPQLKIPHLSKFIGNGSNYLFERGCSVPLVSVSINVREAS